MGYSPILGRFLQRDTEQYIDGLNLYVYVHSSPTNKTDPTGTQTTNGTCKKTLKISFLGANPNHKDPNNFDGRNLIDQGADKTFNSESDKEAVSYIVEYFKNSDPPFDLRISGYSWGGWTAVQLTAELDKRYPSKYKIRIAIVDPVNTLRTGTSKKQPNVIAGTDWYEKHGLQSEFGPLGIELKGVPIDGYSNYDETKNPMILADHNGGYAHIDICRLFCQTAAQTAFADLI